MIDSTRVIFPIDQAFSSGTLEMSQIIPAAYDGPVMRWIDYPANSVMMVILALLCLLTFKDFLSMFPTIASTVVRWKPCINIDKSLQTRSTRNQLAALAFIPMAILTDRFQLIPARLLAEVPAWIHLPAVLGVLVVTLMIRGIVFLICRSKVKKREQFHTAHRAPYNMWILTAVLGILTAGICSVLMVETELARKIILGETAFMFFIALIREAQILRTIYNVFYTFLYLCALEIFPAAVLVAGSLLL